MATVKENLIAAKALIDTPEKWGKGNGFVPPHGCFCAESACAEVARISPDYVVKWRLWRALEDALPEPWKTRCAAAELSVHDFNDDPSTTHADIMALFDRAIAAQEPTHG